MCIQDVKIGRNSGSTRTRVSVTNASIGVLNRNPNRLSLMISPPETGFITISINQPAVSGEGIRLFAGANPLELTVDRLGQWITFPMSMIHSLAVTETIEIWETTLSDGANIS